MLSKIIYSWLISCFLVLDIFALDYEDCAKLFFQEEGLTPEQILTLGNAKTEGSFKPMSPEKRKIFEEAFLAQRSLGFQKEVQQDIRNLEEEDLAHIIDVSTPRMKKHIDDLKVLRSINNTHNLDNLPPNIAKILRSFKYNEGFGRTYLITSAGGAWSRGGNQIKALVPLNIADFITDEEKEILLFADKVFKSSKDTDILRTLLSNKESISIEFVMELYGGDQDSLRLIQLIKPIVDESPKSILQKELLEKICSRTGVTVERIHNLALYAKQQLGTKVRPIIEKAQRSPRAINIIDLKLMAVAILSAITHSYYTLDFWTGEHNHQEIRNYIANFKQIYLSKCFSSDPAVNQQIHDALYNYLQASEQLHETFLFGYMELIPPIDIQRSSSDTVVWQDEGAIRNAPGVNSIIEYLNSTGRIQQLRARGLDTLLFNNLEVLGAIHREIVAHRMVIEADPTVDGTFIFVEKQEGYTGGFAVVDAFGRKLLLEQSQVSEDIRNNFTYFNANTLTISFDAVPSEEIGFETKEQGAIARVKMNLGDLSHVNKTEIVLGAVIQNYINFKSFDHYINNGKKLINEIDEWTSILVTVLLDEGK